MRKYEKPLMVMEEFESNQAIASSCNTVTNVDFTCFRGPQNDERNVLAASPCSPIVTVYEGVNSASSSYKSKTFTGAKGLIAYCTLVRGDSTPITTEWEVSNGILTHKKNTNGSDTHNQDYHCMVAGVTDTVNVSVS